MCTCLTHAHILAYKHTYAYSHFVTGVDEKHQPFFSTETIPGSNIGAWLRNGFASENMQTNVWLDVVGYDPRTFEDLAEALSVDKSLLTEALLFK
jgi:hypothetical protein